MSAKRLDVVSQIGWIRGMEETHTSVKSRCAVEPRWVEPVSWMIPCHLVLLSISQWMILPNEKFWKPYYNIISWFFSASWHWPMPLPKITSLISFVYSVCSVIGELRTESFHWGARSQASRSSNARWPSGAFPLGGTFQDGFFWIEKKSRTNKTCGDSLFLFFSLMNAWNPTIIFNFAIFSQGKRSIITAISTPFCGFWYQKQLPEVMQLRPGWIETADTWALTVRICALKKMRCRWMLGQVGAVWVGNADHLGLQRWLCCRTEGVWFRDLGGRNEDEKLEN